MTGGGTLPLRKPGMFTCFAMRWYAASRLGLSSSNSTSTVSFARVGFSVSTALFTGVLLDAVVLVRSGRQPPFRGAPHRQVSLLQRGQPSEIAPGAAVRRTGRG